MPTPSLQTLVTDAQAVLSLQNMTTIRSAMAVALANANTGTPLSPSLTNQQLINEAFQVMTLPKSDIESIIVNQMMKFLASPPAPGGAGANKQVIWNDAGVLTGAAGLIYDGPTQKLTVGQRIDIWKGLLGDGTSVAVGRNALLLTQAGATSNTAVGDQAGRGITTGANNTFVGTSAGFGNATASTNVAVGVNALLLNTAGSNNVAVGGSSLSSNTANECVAVGSSSLINNTTGVGNIALGHQAGFGVTTGSLNIAIGHNALLANPANVTGANNIAIGQDSMRSLNAITNNSNIGIGVNTLRGLSTGLLNVAIGATAGRSITSAQSCIAIGNNAQGNAAASAISGSFNIAIGDASMFSSANITGADNIGIGRDTFKALSSGATNVGIGLAALLAATTGSNNVAIGSNAGSNITTGTNNICIGVSANASAVGINNELVIGSTTSFVGTNGGATTYFTTASALSSGTLPANCGFIRIYLNGSFVKIPVYGN